MTDVTIPQRLSGHEILSDNLFNNGSAFASDLRAALKLDGLLKPVVNTIEEQEVKIMDNHDIKSSNMGE